MNKKLLMYFPHGVDSEIFRPITESDTDDWKNLLELKKTFFGESEIKYILLFNSRNIRRKMVSDIILAFKVFCDTLNIEDASKCALILHTQPVDDNGTDLPAVINDLCPDYKVCISANKVSSYVLNLLYNMSNVVINIASNEGWGLCTTEGLMAGVPFIGNVTGGIQDQMRFVDENNNWIDFNKDWPSNHDGRYNKCGEWAFPVFPSTRSIMGSPMTPYIFDDRCNFENVAKTIKYTYELGASELKRRGLLGREWLLSYEAGMSSKKMGEKFIKGVDETIKNFTPRERIKIDAVK